MGTDRVKVLVLYSHALLGQGLERLLAAERALEVHAVDEADEGAVADGLGAQPDVIVFEEGGRLDALELMRRTTCPLLIDLSIGSSDAWTIRRDTIRTAPDRLFEVILGACLGRGEVTLPPGSAITVVGQPTATDEVARAAALPVPG